ncbi:ATP-binding protein [Candidatus Woesearchaeota archaeon]|nr:ATP-binding protein [Candidatus Woesearchaeota archaeon]
MGELPFFAGQEVGPPFFFDREDYILSLREKLISKAPLNFAITGQRRIGKTSLMKRLAEEIKEEVIPIFIKCEKIIPKTELEFANFIAREFQKKLIVLHPMSKFKKYIADLKEKINVKIGTSITQDSEMFLKVELKDNQKISIAYDFAFELIDRIHKSEGKKIVIFLDEFQELFEFGNDYLWSLRSYISDSKASFVVSSSYHRFKELLLDEKQPFFNFFEIQEVGPIQDKYCREYVVSRLEKVGITINEKALDELIRVSQGKPYYLQLIGSKAYDICKRENSQEIIWLIYLKAFNEIMLSPPAQLLSAFNRLTGKTKRVFIALCLYNVRNSTELAGKVDMAPSHVTQLLNQLHRIHGLITRNNGFFKVSDEILREWIKREFTIKKVDQISSPYL